MQKSGSLAAVLTCHPFVGELVNYLLRFPFGDKLVFIVLLKNKKTRCLSRVSIIILIINPLYVLTKGFSLLNVENCKA